MMQLIFDAATSVTTLIEIPDATETTHITVAEPTLEERNRADIDYLAMMLEVEL